MINGLGPLLTALKAWSPLVGAIITIIFMAGMNYKSLQDVTARVDRIESKLDAMILELHNGHQ